MTQHYPPPPANQRSPYDAPYQKIASNLHYWRSSFGSCQTQAQPQLHGQPIGASSAALHRAASSLPAGYPTYAASAYYASSEYPPPSPSPPSSSYLRNVYGNALGGSSNSFVADHSHYGGAARPAPHPPAAALSLPAVGYEHCQDQRQHHDGPCGAQGSAAVATRSRLGDTFYIEPTASQPGPELVVRAPHRAPPVQHDYARTNNASLQHILREQTVTHASELPAPLPTAGHDQLGPSANPHGFQDIAGPQPLPGPSNMVSYPVTHHRFAVTRPLNDSSYSVPALQARPAHTSRTWPAGQPAAYTTAASHDSYTSIPLVRGSVDTSPDNFTGLEWSMLPGEVGGSTSPVYELEADPEWMLLKPHADAHALRPAQESVHSQVAHHVQPLVSAPEPAPLFARQGAKKTSGRKDKPPKVSSSYTRRAVKSKVSKRSNKLSDDAKANASAVRSIGACARCKFYKNKCDGGMPCGSCSKSVANARVYKIPCTREKLEDVALVRRCNGRFAQDCAAFITDYSWIEGVFNIEFKWNLPPSGDPLVDPSQMAPCSIRVKCQRYSPGQTELDTTSSPWQDVSGHVRIVSQDPYAIFDTVHFQMQVHQYLMIKLMPWLEDEVLSRMRNDDLASLTWREAGRFHQDHNSELLDVCKKILCLSMVSQGYGNVISNDIPGVLKYDESGFSSMGHTLYEAYNRSSHDRPLPTAINHSWDVAVLFLLRQLETKALSLLSKKIFGVSHKSNIPWYEIYLAYFLLIWNMAFIKSSATRYIESKSNTQLENQVRAIVSRQMADWDRSFPLLLIYWQGVLRGYEPFMLARENPEELRLNGHVDHLGFRYMRKASAILGRKGIDRHHAHLNAPSPISSEWIQNLVREAGAKY